MRLENYECPWVQFRGEESTIRVLLWRARWYKRALYTCELLGPYAAVKAVLAGIVQQKDLTYGLKACAWCEVSLANRHSHGWWAGRKGSFRVVGLSGFLAHGSYCAREVQLRRWKEGDPFVVCGDSALQFLKTSQARYAIPCPEEAAPEILNHIKAQTKRDPRQPWEGIPGALALDSLGPGGYLVNAVEADFDLAVSSVARSGGIQWD